MNLFSLFNRIKSDYFLFDRIKEYEELLRFAQQNGYLILSHSEYYHLVKANELTNKKILIIRQDIDSDPKYALKWLEVQQKFNVHSTMYFRLCTYHKPTMIAVRLSGSDCGYHYEEIADYAKTNSIKDPKKIKECVPEIQALFKTNLKQMEAKLGFKINCVASHGDFANRALDLPNRYIMLPGLLKECGLDFEAYDAEFTETYTIHISDCGAPKFYKGETTPHQAIEQQMPIIELLMHPKHWRSSWFWNTYENVKRLRQGISFR